jgi:cytochrome c-type biogenesis protein CcmH/NrfF
MARWQVDAAVLAAFALSPKMSHLEVARRIAFLLSNPLRKTERLVDVRRLRCFSCSALGHQSLRGSNPDVREELRADV